MILTQIDLTNLGIIAAKHIDVPAGGIVLAGRNGSGKSTVLGGLVALLAGEGIDPSAIRHGEEEAKITVTMSDEDLGDISAGLTINGRSDPRSLRGGDGKPVPMPKGVGIMTWLKDRVGKMPLRPDDFLLETKEKRVDLLLKAVALKCDDPEFLPFVRGIVPLKEALLREAIGDLGVHALVGLDRASKWLAAKRADVGRGVECLKAEEARLAVEEAAARATLPAGAAERPDATAVLEERRAGLQRLQNRDAEAVAQEARTADARRRIEAREVELDRARAEVATVEPAEMGEARTKRAFAGSQVEKAERAEKEAEEALVRARAATAEAKGDFAKADAYVLTLEQQERDGRAAQQRVVDLERQLEDQRSMLAAAAAPRVAAEEFAAARVAVAAAAEGVRVHALCVKHRELSALLSNTGAERARQGAIWTQLNEYTRKLEADAPRALVTKANLVPGLRLKGGDIYVGETPFDRLSESERYAFAVDLAKRYAIASGKRNRFMFLDGLERFDDAQRQVLYDAIVGDREWQVIGARACYEVAGKPLAKGEFVVEYVQASPGAAKASPLEHVSAAASEPDLFT